MRVVMPKSLDELWLEMNRLPEAGLYAGGTDYLVRKRAGLVNPKALICLERVAELKGLTLQDGAYMLGSGLSHADILGDHALCRDLPLLAAALKSLGSPPIRRMGTIGGNLVTASPAGDSLPALYVMKARICLAGPGGERELPIGEFIKGPGTTGLKPGEIVKSIKVRVPDKPGLVHFEKVGQRAALAISLASLAARLELDDRGLVSAAALAWGSVGPTVVTSKEAEACLIGRPLCVESLKRAGQAAYKAVSPISDVRASADYRKKLAANLVMRLLDLA